jgi:anaerobic magnesium-protoporphyrin IX monomethyl ester cyclase
MRLLLVHAALSRRLDRFPSRPPLGVAYLAAAARQAGHDCRVVDEQFEPDLLALMDAYQPQAVGFSVTTWAAPRVLQEVAAIRREFPRTVILAGGPHATALPASLLEGGVDVVVRGYGERILVEVLEALEQHRPLATVAGIAFVADGRLVQTAPAADLDLNDLPPADYAQFDLPRYRWCSVSSSRGCSVGCAFCSDSFLFGRKVSLRKPEHFVDELVRLHAGYGLRDFYVVDEQFTLSERRVLEICDLIRRAGLNIEWTVNSRVDCVTAEMLSRMREAGCRSIAFGVESGSEQILQAIHKRITPAQVEKAVESAKQAGLRVKTSWIVGLPGPMAEQLKSIDLMERTQPDHIDVFWLTLYPGTPFWEAPERYGIHFDPRDVPTTANAKLASRSCYFDYLSKTEVLEVARQMTERMRKLGYREAELEENDYRPGSRFIATYLRYLDRPDFSQELAKG